MRRNSILRQVGLCLALAFALSGCRRQGEEPLLLFCGAGIRPAMTPILEACLKQDGPKVVPTYAGSGQLLGQISSFQKGDLFMPGEDFYVDEAIRKGLADPSTKRTVAFFIPVIFVPKGNPLQIKTLRDLARPGLRLGLGDERACAVGKQAQALFDKNGLSAAALASNTVYTSGTVDELGVAVKLGQVDATLVWDVTARNFSDDGTPVEIPAAENLPAAISVVVLRSSTDPARAREVVRFLEGDSAKALFEQRHFRTSLMDYK
jgi:molybdate transport system substrate-binding protein